MAVDSVVDTGSLVRVHDDGPVRVVTLNRPERHNALVPELIDGVRAAIRGAAAAPTVRAVVLAAEGGNFSTGGDVAEFASRSGPKLTRYAREIVGGLNAMMIELIALDVPVVAAVHGAVTGGSLGFVLASDVVVASPNATFTPYYVDVGFSPDGGWTALLPDRIGSARAMFIQVDNRILDARTAHDWGLIAELVTSGDVRAAAVERAKGFAAKKPAAIRRTKRLLWGDLAAISARLDAELESFVEQVVTEEATTGMAAFLARGHRSSTPPAH